MHIGPDAMDLFLMELEELETEIQDDLRAVVPIDLTEAEENQFSGTEKCWICDIAVYLCTIHHAPLFIFSSFHLRLHHHHHLINTLVRYRILIVLVVHREILFE